MSFRRGWPSLYPPINSPQGGKKKKKKKKKRRLSNYVIKIILAPPVKNQGHDGCQLDEQKWAFSHMRHITMPLSFY
jgi:hypothetical protein